MNQHDTPQPARSVESGSPAEPPRRRRLSQWAVIAGAVLLVVGPVVYLELPHEIARWYAAASDEHRLNGDYPAAIRQLTSALEWNDESPRMLVERARLKMRLRDWAGALEDCDRARQLPGGTLLSAAPRTECLHQLGRHAEAAQQWRDLLADADENSDDPGRAQLLNGFAYACAVGNLDLDEALAAADEAIALSVQETALLDPEGVYFAARADVERELGRMSAALASYLRAGKSAAEALRRETLRHEALKSSDDEGGGSADEYARRVAALRPHLAGILRERAELYEKLEKPDQAKRDREALDSLSHDGNLSVAVPLTWAAANQALFSNAAVLDTRGLVYYHCNQLEQALQDMDNAVESAEWHLKAAEWMDQVNRHSTVDLRQQAEAKYDLSRGVAVIRYHRMLVLEKMDRMKRAAEDRARIERLGFEPNDDLF